MFDFNVNGFQLISISACINGAIFCWLLLTKNENRRANQFLAILILSLVETIATYLILDFQLFDPFPWLHWFPFSMTFWIGPAFYFYIRHLIDPGFQFRFKDYWHFSFIFFNYLHSIYHLIYGRNILHPLFHNFTEAVSSYAIISIFIYLLLSYQGVSRYQKAILHQISNIDDVQLTWIKQIIIQVTLTTLFIAIFKLVDYKELIDFSRESYEGILFPYRGVISVVLSIVIYWLSIGGYGQLQTISSLTVPGKQAEGKDFSPVIEKLVYAMEHEQLYLNTALDLHRLSTETAISEKDISTALNQFLNKNFYTFVNEYRVEEVKKRLANPKFNHLKILSIAFDSGFSSKATFNRIFKSYTGKSPIEYRSS